ncbi:histone-like nucleoid-structuring protein Lsr2 [Streptomyces sp. SBT349]|uniref:histone-like nucleoid-structuring protein Lsr2 n=1 Tax=Streptomyces sp. SBT349 TaxID=1580539 RepID=UPI00066C16EB|nr:Lsr2 family protein [Streptomyces sp. SBT349]
MAKKIVTVYTDDLTGAEAEDVDTHRFALDGVNYEIDLTSDSFDKLLEALNPFIENGRKTVRGKRAAIGARRAAAVDSSKIREWAKEQGIEVSERGRVPASVREAYEKAH